MLTEPEIKRELIKSKLEENYGIKVTKLTFNTAGEASWSYKVETESGELFFFKIHNSLLHYKIRFDLTYKLFNDCGIKNITHPIKNTNGELIIQIDNYPAALFNYINGNNASENDLNNDQKSALGKLLGQIHKAKDAIGDFEIKEDFAYGNKDRLLDSINNAQDLLNEESEYIKKVAELLIEYKDRILNQLKVLEELGNKLRNSEISFVICHGEPHRWNTMVNNKGEVFLIDWDDSIFAPKEKDLTMVKDDSLVLEGYKSVVGDFNLNQEVIRYYDLEWNISEIDAWSKQILYDNTNDIQNQHDLEFLISELNTLSLMQKTKDRT